MSALNGDSAIQALPATIIEGIEIVPRGLAVDLPVHLSSRMPHIQHRHAFSAGGVVGIMAVRTTYIPNCEFTITT